MPYTSNIKSYGAPADERVERPDTWRWKKDEPPVAEYLNDLYHNVITDVQHLIDLTNSIDPDNDGVVKDSDKVDGFHASELGGFKYNQTENPQEPSIGNSWFKQSNGIIFVGDGSKYTPQPEIGYQETLNVGNSDFSVSHESPVARTETNPDGSVTLINEVTVADFEDGIAPEISDWEWNNSPDLTAQSTQVISGTQSGEFASSNEFNFISLTREFDVIQDAGISVQIGSDTGNIADFTKLLVKSSNGDVIGGIRFSDGNGTIQRVNGNNNSVEDLSSAWSVDTTYSFEWDFDFDAGTFDLYMNGALVGNYAIPAGRTGFGRFTVQQDTSTSGLSRSVFVDDFYTGAREAGEVVITGPEPDTRIQHWDTIRLFRATNSETIAVDIEDESGATLISDVQSEDDISAYIDSGTNFQLRVRFARNDIMNRPVLNGLYRRWTMRPGDIELSESEKEQLDEKILATGLMDF